MRYEYKNENVKNSKKLNMIYKQNYYVICFFFWLYYKQEKNVFDKIIIYMLYVETRIYNISKMHEF